ncbi:restriction endonuclease subunit S [Escherichia coli]
MERLALMPKYEDYVDSGVEWLGDLPSHWDAVKMKFLFKDTSMKNKPNETLLSVTQNQGVVPREWVENRMVMPSGNLESFKFIAKGDFAISLRSFEGGLEYCHHDGIISPAYTVLKTKKDYLLAGYYKYLFKSQTFISELQTSIVGIREGKNISYEELQYSLLPIPAEEEQTRIANFLDKKTALIDEAISIKEKQINLLKEHKQIIIQQAVTQGLDPNVPMKDSGVDWIGKIPAHWDLVKLGSCLSPVSVKNCSELPLLSITREQGVIERDVDDKESNHNFIPDDLSGYKKLEKGQFGMNKMKAWQGSYGVSKFTGIVSPAYFIFDFTKAINPEFFNWAIRSKLYVSFFGSASDGVRIGQWDLSKARMKVIPFVLPSEEEQLLIAKHLDEKLEQVDVAIKIKLQQIERLREYRSSLINSAVTGKIKITPEMVEQ